jgi:hypothetical protein
VQKVVFWRRTHPSFKSPLRPVKQTPVRQLADCPLKGALYCCFLEIRKLKGAAFNKLYRRVIDRSMFYGAKAETFATAHLLRKNMTLEEVIL